LPRCRNARACGCNEPRRNGASEDGGLWNYVDPRRTYSRLDFDRTQTFTQSFVYELPFGANKPFLKTGIGRWLLGDWQLNGVLTFMTGRPFTVGSTVSANTPGSRCILPGR
jgi:hypothetical protein